MADLEHEARVWADWIAKACAAVDVDPALVDVSAVHDLTRVIAREVIRPMAPVSAFILGLAVAQQPLADRRELGAAIAAAQLEA